MPRARELPGRARVVIVGGGVSGTSIAYHLVALGEPDVVLVDRAELTSGSTFYGAAVAEPAQIQEYLRQARRLGRDFAAPALAPALAGTSAQQGGSDHAG